MVFLSRVFSQWTQPLNWQVLLCGFVFERGSFENGCRRNSHPSAWRRRRRKKLYCPTTGKFVLLQQTRTTNSQVYCETTKPCQGRIIYRFLHCCRSTSWFPSLLWFGEVKFSTVDIDCFVVSASHSDLYWGWKPLPQHWFLFWKLAFHPTSTYTAWPKKKSPPMQYWIITALLVIFQLATRLFKPNWCNGLLHISFNT